MTTHRAYRAAILLVCALTVGAVSACGSDQATGPDFDPLPVIVPDSELAAEVPPAISANGILTIATDKTYPPMEFVEDGRLRGVDIDLGRALAETLELKASFEDAQFSNIVSSVAVNRFELGMSALWADNPTASLANTVTYMDAGVQIAGRSGNEAPANSGLGMCGHSVSVEEGTDYIDTMVKLSRECRQLGRQPIDIHASDNQQAATALLKAGAVDAMLADSPAVIYAVEESNGQLEAIGKPVDIRQYGIAVSPSYREFASVIQRALSRLIESGVYQRILDRWGLAASAIDKPQVIWGAHTELLETPSSAPAR